MKSEDNPKPSNYDALLALYGVSQHLVDLLSSIAQSTTPNGALRYTEKTLKGLQKIVICRQYARPIWWLVNLILLIESSKKMSFYEFFFDERSNKRAKLELITDEMQDAVKSLDANAIDLVFQDKEFRLYYSYLPLLQSLIEFLVCIDDQLFERLARYSGQWTTESVNSLSKELRLVLEGYLETNLQPRQQYEKCNKILTWLEATNIQISHKSLDIDETILQYWIYAVENQIKDFKLFGKCAISVITFFEVIKESETNNWWMSNAHYSTDSLYGEWNNEYTEQCFDYVVNEKSSLEKLQHEPLNKIKFIKNKEDMLFLSMIDSLTFNNVLLQKTYLRYFIFAQCQLSIGQFLRKGNKTEQYKRLVRCEDLKKDYRGVLDGVDDTLKNIIKTEGCVMFILLKTRSPEFFVNIIEHFSVESKTDMEKQIRLYRTTEHGAIDWAGLFANVDDIALLVPEFGEKLFSIRSGFRTIKRAGLVDIPHIDSTPFYVDGIEILKELRIKLQKHRLSLKTKEEAIALLYLKDKELFSNIFNKLYGE